MIADMPIRFRFHMNASPVHVVLERTRLMPRLDFTGKVIRYLIGQSKRYRWAKDIRSWMPETWTISAVGREGEAITIDLR